MQSGRSSQDLHFNPVKIPSMTAEIISTEGAAGAQFKIMQLRFYSLHIYFQQKKVSQNFRNRLPKKAFLFAKPVRTEVYLTQPYAVQGVH